MIQIYTIDGERLKDLLDDNIAFRRFVLLRATQRRSHFLKILEECRQLHELNRKYNLLGDNLDAETVYFNTYMRRQVHHFKHLRDPESIRLLQKDPYAMHSAAQLQDEFVLFTQSRISRQLRDLKRVVPRVKINPLSLQARVQAIDLGYHLM